MQAGRKSKFISTTLSLFLDDFAKTRNKAHACAIAGISPKTLHNWLQLGENQRKGAYRNFYQSVKRVEADHKMELLAQIELAGKNPQQWQANAWLLERLYPDEFGQVRQLNLRIEEEMNRFFTMMEQKLSPEEYAKIVAIAAGEVGQEEAAD